MGRDFQTKSRKQKNNKIEIRWCMQRTKLIPFPMKKCKFQVQIRKLVHLIERALKMIAKEFCESTSLHGYSYLYNSHSIVSKIVWTITILTSICLGTFFLAIQTKQFLDKEIITTVETSSLPLRVRNVVNKVDLHFQS